MKINPKQYAIALYESVKDKKDSEVKHVTKQFGELLKKNGDLAKLDKIISQFNVVWNEKEGIVDAEIESARELDQKIVKLLNNYIIELSGANDVIIKQKVNSKLLGGVVLRYGDKIVDASLRGKMKTIEEKIS
ncbi:MAG: ATP synthase F1 subunit delta [Patescibacteria group bacterium]|nr:ATP synthase F1 subunit delta [Patescibacteria group bacterium]MDD4610388.1 ATP synthase F1 subunit delta [Patescibacteria group bacterium]